MNLTEKQIEGMKKDFKNFLYMVFMNLEELKIPPSKLQYSIADYLQYGYKFRIVEAFRGVGKSYITVCFVLWHLWKNPNYKILILSASKERADQFALFVRNIIRTIGFLNHLTPDKEKGNKDTQSIFDVNGSAVSGTPSVRSLGITSTMTGGRADLIIADDVEVPNNSATHDQRTKLANRVTEFFALLKPKGHVVYLGTPQTEMSLYNSLVTHNKFDINIWPVRVPSFEQAAKYKGRLAPYIKDLMDELPVGHSTEPRFTEEDLQERRVGYGASGFTLQFMLDTSLTDAEKYPLTISDLIIYDVKDNVAPSEIYHTNNPVHVLSKLPNVAMEGQQYFSPESLSQVMAPYQAKVMAIDPSGRGKDETGVGVAKMLNGNIFLKKLTGLKGGYSDEVMTAIAEMAKAEGVNKIIVESNFGDGMFTQLLKPHLTRIYPCMVEEVRNSKQKELRIIDTLEPVLNQHRLIVDPKVIIDDYQSAMENYDQDKALQYMLFYQLSRISKDRGALKHDDRLDTLAILVGALNSTLAVDQKMQEKRRQDQLFEEQVKALEARINKNKPQSGNSILMRRRLDR